MAHADYVSFDPKVILGRGGFATVEKLKHRSDETKVRMPLHS